MFEQGYGVCQKLVKTHKLDIAHIMPLAQGLSPGPMSGLGQQFSQAQAHSSPGPALGFRPKPGPAHHYSGVVGGKAGSARPCRLRSQFSLELSLLYLTAASSLYGSIPRRIRSDSVQVKGLHQHDITLKLSQQEYLEMYRYQTALRF